jgi:hypothetical protein
MAEPNPLTSGLLTIVEENHIDMAALVKGVPIEGLKWMPVKETPHLSGHVLHVLEVEDYMARVLGGEEVEWTRPLGSSLSFVMPAPKLVERIGETDLRLRTAILRCPPERLALPQPGGERLIGEMLVEDLAHSSQHLGHMQLTRLLMVQTLKSLQVPEYAPWA